jgi:hypothetical protein
MPALLKTTQIQEPSSATINLALDTSGGVTAGQNLTVTGTTTFTGGIVSAGLPLKGSSSGTTTIQAAATASGTVTIPAGTGTAAVQGVSTNIVTGTSQATTSGTSITFSSIPSWVRRITVILNGISTSGTSQILIRIGSGSVTSTGYSSQSSLVYSATGMVTQTTGFAVFQDNSAYTTYGNITLTNPTGNTWIASGTGINSTSTPFCWLMGGTVALSGVLDRVVLTTVNGTDTFDAGSINILYE